MPPNPAMVNVARTPGASSLLTTPSRGTSASRVWEKAGSRQSFPSYSSRLPTRHGPDSCDSTVNSTRSSTWDSGTVFGFCGCSAGLMAGLGKRKSVWARKYSPTVTTASSGRARSARRAS